MNKEIVSKQFTLEWRDILKGFLMAVLTPAIVIFQQSLDAGQLIFNWKAIGMAAVGGGFAYLVKNFLEPSKVIEIKQVKKKPEFKSDEEIGI